MLSAYTGTSTSDSTSNTATTGNPGVVATNDSSAPPTKKVTTIGVPVIVGVLLALPVIIYFIRRRIRIAKKRRMARHFSFSSQEDGGDFANPLEQHRTTATQYSFGRDANEHDGNFITDIGNGLVSILKRYSRSSTESTRRDRSSKGSKVSEKAMNWEEIDFGLGKLDERRSSSRHSSFSAPSISPTQRRTPDFAMPIASTAPAYEPRLSFSSSQENGPLIVSINDVGTPRSDGQVPLVPSLVLMPSTPIQELNLIYPTTAPTLASAPTQAESLDWSMLQQELESKPVFRSISSTSTLRSHAHPTAPTGTVSLVNPKTGRRSLEALPFESSRRASQPFSGRQLTGNYGGRGSSTFPQHSPGSSGSSTPTGRPAAAAPAVRRTSTPLDVPVSSQGARREGVQSKLRVVNVSDDEEEAGQAI